MNDQAIIQRLNQTPDIVRALAKKGIQVNGIMITAGAPVIDVVPCKAVTEISSAITNVNNRGDRGAPVSYINFQGCKVQWVNH